MPHPSRIFFTLFVSLCLAIASYAADYKAPAEYTLREWHVSDGLPSDEIGSLMQDERGYLWIASTGGLVRFDGTIFNSVKTSPEISARGMIYSRTWTGKGRTGFITQGSSGTTADGNVPGSSDGYYIRENNVFRFVQEPLLTGKNVKSIFSQEDGTAWLGCEDGTIFRRRGEETEIYPAPPGLIGKKIPGFATDGKNQLWVSISTTIARYDGSRWIPLPVDHGEAEISIASSKTDGPWVFTRTALLKWSNGQLKEITKLPELLGTHFIQAAVEDQHGALWIGTRSQGLFRIIGDEILHVPTSHDDVYSIYEDTEGGIWAGTNGGGLNRLRPKAYRLYDKTSGLKDNFSYTVCEDAQGTIWLANRDGGVARIIKDVVDPISRRAGWRPFSAMSVFPAADGGIWVTSGIGVYRTDAQDPEKLLRIRSLDTFKIVRSTLVTRNGDYWLSADPDHVARWRDGQVTTFGPAEGVDGREIRAIAEDHTGTIWLGAADGRLFRSKNERFERVPMEGDETFGSLQTLYFEADDTLLIGSTRRGVLILRPDDRTHPCILGSEQGLPSDNISQIITDNNDRYWFGSRSGIFRIFRPQLRELIDGKIKRLHAIPLGKDDGVPDLSCLGLFHPSVWKSHTGNLWFATRRGMLRIDPSLTSSNESPVPVSISAVKYDGREQPLAREMKVSSTVRKTEIHFSALNISTPERVLARYRLDGFDNDWVLQASGRVATYPRLPPGKYVFRVMASNGYGEWDDAGTQLNLTVFPPWWQSTWAQLIYLFSLVIVVGVTVRISSHRRLRLRLQKLEQAQAIELERTRIARNIHDELGASLTHISLITQAAQHANPAQTDSFEKIYEATHEITRSMDEVVWAVNPKCDDMESLVYYVGNFAQRLLSAAGIRCRLDLPQKLPPLRLASPIRHNLFLCCKEALNNAVKHAQADLISIAITVNEAKLQIVITDNGRGLSPTGSPAQPDRNRLAGGSGLDNLRNRMAEVGGTCEFSTPPEGGLIVTFAIIIPSTS